MPALSAFGFVFYAAVLLSAFAIRGVAGFGAGLVAIPMLAFILPVSTAVSVATVLTTLTSAELVIREWRYIAWRQFAVIFLYSMLGIAVGLYFIHLLDEDVLRRCMGVFLILYALHALWAADTARFVPKRWHGVLGAGVGIVGGLFSAMFGAGAGPIYVVYFDILRLEKAVFRATMSAVVVLGGAARIVGYESYGFYAGSSLVLLAVGVPLVLVGARIGDRLVYRLSARSFSRVVAIIILGSGVTFVIR